MLAVFSNNLVPVLLAAGTGFLLARFLRTDPRPLSQIIFYIFTPCLIFNLITNSQLSGREILRMMLFASTMISLVGLLTFFIGRLIKLERRMLAAVMLTTMFMNAGNFGLPISQFALGEAALAFASLYFVTSAIFSYTVGVVIASMGSTSFLQAIRNLLKIPTMYALVLAFIFLRTGWKLPLPVQRTTTLLSDAAIPSMLVLLGMQFQQVRWSGNLKPLALTHAVRLVLAPILAVVAGAAFALQSTASQAGLLESAMPTAVMTTVLATEYDTEPAFVTSAVLATTLFSIITLTFLLAYLGG